MEVLEDQHEGLLSGFPQEQPPDCVDDTLATLPRIDRLPGGVVFRDVEQSKQRWQCWLKGFVQSEQLVRHLVADLARVIPVLNLEVALEEVDHWQVARRF